ncbi:cardiolipin-specific phospholipase, partial [Tremellales sp. Uapishka_1]
PTSFATSVGAWWNNSSYKEARLAEERLLRRLPTFVPPAEPQAQGSWFGWGSAKSNEAEVVAEATAPAPENGLVATLKNVFIPSPNPADAPANPTDLYIDTTSPASSTTSFGREKKQHFRKVKEGKLVDYINTLEVSTKANAASKEGVVVLHGYAAALGFFFRNWQPISEAGAASHRRTFFLDWLGMGLSSRPSPSLLAAPSNATLETRVSTAENFFLASLESWRIAAGLDKMLLVGHSLGGYLISAYAVRYPERVSGLILVSPAGIPHGPKEGFGVIKKNSGPTGPGGKKWKDGKEMEEEVDVAERELMEDERETMNASAKANGKPEASGEAKEWQKKQEASFFRRNASKAFVWGWEKGLSPFSVLRAMGPWGPMMVGGYSRRRFAAQSEEDVRDLHNYIYNTSIMKGSGEYCISHILAPGAHARTPIVDRIGKVKVPVTFLYGDNDWMDMKGGHASVVELNKAGNTKARVHVVPKAGHHVYLDNPDETNRIIQEAIQSIPLTA